MDNISTLLDALSWEDVPNKCRNCRTAELKQVAFFHHPCAKYRGLMCRPCFADKYGQCVECLKTGDLDVKFTPAYKVCVEHYPAVAAARKAANKRCRLNRRQHIHNIYNTEFPDHGWQDVTESDEEGDSEDVDYSVGWETLTDPSESGPDVAEAPAPVVEEQDHVETTDTESEQLVEQYDMVPCARAIARMIARMPVETVRVIALDMMDACPDMFTVIVEIDRDASVLMAKSLYSV